MTDCAFAGELRCGASAVDVTPRHLPVIRNGGFLEAQDNKILDPLHARCVVLDDGTSKVAIVVVDNCMLPTTLCDQSKKLAHEATGIPTDHIMISATHTHTAPSVMRYCLGSGIDERYTEFLPAKIAEAVTLANSRLRRAKVGWAKIDASRFTKCRRWITRTDKLQRDPFGELTVHANMHPGHQNSDFLGPSGPIDPWLSLLMIADTEGHPMAALANFSMHYFGGHAGVSADYFGQYCVELANRMNKTRGGQPKFVGIMSQGTSGDLWWGDYSQPRSKRAFKDHKQFAKELVELTMQAVGEIDYEDDVPVRIAEQRLTLKRRQPDKERLTWARRMNKLRGDRKPKDRPEVYALQAEYLLENPTDEVVLQAIRIGDFGITGIPNEVYALTGLKLKRRSPLAITMNVSLANGACGYIPPPEQHALGGYNTWPARTAGLEVAAEPKIVSALLELLEQVADKPRQQYMEAETEFSRHVSKTHPLASWRFAELQQTDGPDASAAIRVSGPVAYHLPGRIGAGFGSTHDSHAIQLAGGKLVADELALGESYSVQFSFYLGTPVDFRGQTGTLISRGGDTLVITGSNVTASGEKLPGRVAFGGHVGSTQIEPKRWYQCVFVRNGDFVEVFLDGVKEREISAKVGRIETSQAGSTLMLGGDRMNSANFEGKFDEVSVYDRALTKEEVRGLFDAAGLNVTEATTDALDSPSLDSPPLDAKTSMQQIHVRDGYRVELVAAEPMVVDPVAIDWGSDGKLWVAEMSDYPMGMDGKGKPGGRIRYLEDTNNDGQFDRSTVFLENVSFPNGIMAWRDGVLVTAAPEIFYAEDTDGDGKADKRETLLSGFMTGNQQLRVNGLRWGLDGMVHCASGAHHAGFGSDNSIFSTKLGESIRLGSRDFRFAPETGMLDPQSGPSQYGRVRDDFGNWFGVQNSQPLWHNVLRDHYTRRNIEVPTIDPRQQVRVPRMPEVYSAKPPQRRFHGFDHAGHYTSACGISIYRDELLFPRNEIHAFTCAPFHNLVQHHRLENDGTSFRGQRADDGPIDFFASSDRWTRPVMSRTGPDGALWIVDMYRYMIEHPQWLPKNGQDALRAGYRAGDQLGRIYRIVPEGKQVRSVPKTKGASTEELVSLLEHPNGLVRDSAQRELLVSKTSERLVLQEELRNVAREGKSPESRIQALATIASLDRLDAPTIRVATKDEHAAVRRFSVLLAESLPNDVIEQSGVFDLVDDSNAKVRLQLASSLGGWDFPAASHALLNLAQRQDNDRFTKSAIIGSLPLHYAAFCGAAKQTVSGGREVLDAMLLMGESRPVRLAQLLDELFSNSIQLQLRMHITTGWLDQLEDRNQSFATLHHQHPTLSKAYKRFNELSDEACSISEDENRNLFLRVASIGLLGREPRDYEADIAILNRLLQPNVRQALQAAAIKRLSRIPTNEAANAMLQNWSSYLPSQQQTAAVALLSRADWSLLLLDAIDEGSIPANDLSLAQQQSLRNARDKQVAESAREVFRALGQANANQLMEDYSEEVYLGNPAEGRQVFDENCKVCHTLDRNQKPVGPDLRTLTGRSREALLTAILDPSQSIEPKYANYTVVLANGEVLSGVVTGESGGSLTLVNSEGKQRSVLRSSIELTKRIEKSLMPEGFETKITPTQMSHLLAFLRDL